MLYVLIAAETGRIASAPLPLAEAAELQWKLAEIGQTYFLAIA